MKKLLTILAIVCVLAAALSIGVFALTQDNAGVYQIATAEDLIEFRNTAANGASAVLTADIDMTGKEWTPFEKTVISIDGQGHSIIGLSATVSELTGTAEATAMSGLLVGFLANGPVNPTIKNIVFKDGSFTVNNATGACQIGFVAGYADRANITGVTLDNCTMTVNHSGTGELCVGMIAGRAEWSAQDNEIKIDGIVKANSTLTVNADAKDNTYVGGIVGAHASDTLAVRNSQFNGTINGTVDTSKIAAIACQMWGPVIMSGNTTTTSYPITLTPGSIKEYFTVGTTDELNAAVAKYNSGAIGYAYITITADLDYTGKTWTPITANFKGELNGQNHTISGINLTYANVNEGHFGILVNTASNGGGANGRIVNLTLKDSSITVTSVEAATGGIYVGGVTGYYDRGHIENITLQNVDVKMSGKTSGECCVGGVAGKLEWAGPNGAVGIYNVTVDKNSSVVADTTDTNARAGGIAGMAGSSDKYEFDNCVNYASVTSSHTAAGIVGYSSHWNAPANTIKNSKNYGTVEGATIAASIVGPCEGATLTLENVVAGGFVIGAGEVYGTGKAEATLTNVKEVSIVNPLTDKDLAGYYQTAAPTEATRNLRVVFLAKIDYITSVDALNINITFTKADATVKQYNGKLGNEVYKTVTAQDDAYTAPDDMALFGNIITGIPTAEADGFTITVTDGEGNVVFTGTGTIA